MRDGRPSATALRVAIERAAHQVFDQPVFFHDALALAILDPVSAQQACHEPWMARLTQRRERAFVAARSRIAEDEIAKQVVLGCRQAVVLGAGLDTYAWRHPHQAVGLHVFEVDHPATQAWKRQRLQAAGLAEAGDAVLVPVDFEQDDLLACLQQAGFDPTQPAVFSWLGVTYYLSRAAITATLRTIAGLQAPACVVFDYFQPPPWRKLGCCLALWGLRQRFSWLGEPWRTVLAPEELRGMVQQAGLQIAMDLDGDAIAERLLIGQRKEMRLGTLGRIAVAHKGFAAGSRQKGDALS